MVSEEEGGMISVPDYVVRQEEPLDDFSELSNPLTKVQVFFGNGSWVELESVDAEIEFFYSGSPSPVPRGESSQLRRFSIQGTLSSKVINKPGVK
jgi:hypothetical protein